MLQKHSKQIYTVSGLLWVLVQSRLFGFHTADNVRRAVLLSAGAMGLQSQNVINTLHWGWTIIAIPYCPAEVQSYTKRHSAWPRQLQRYITKPF